ncbi:ATP-binding cassette domain-containing protein [Staphylococcus aureus]|uniref:ATP-binding cassette domain-containing protein n=1 Tax=Staphylococcus aureus TaxID=1280 RepID=UPI003D6E7E52
MDFLGYDPTKEYVKVNHKGKYVRSIEYITKDIPSFLKSRLLIVIKLENVFVKKGNKNILDGCNFNFEKGKSYALVGESGAGKSTLLNIIAGFEDVSQGSIYIEDKLLKKESRFL